MPVLKRFYSALVTISALGALSGIATAAAPPGAEQAPHKAGRALVGVSADGRGAAEQSIRGNGGKVLSYYAAGNFYEVQAPGSAPDFVRVMRGRPGIRYAEPDYQLTASVVPNDPYWSQMWGLQKVGMPTAWDTGTGSSSVVVGVIDSGVDYNHQDLGPSQMWTNPGEAANGADDDSNGFVDDLYGADCINNDGNPMDDHNHGTHVAGTIGAATNNAIGVPGLNWNVKIMALKFLGADGSGWTSDAVQCLDYAVAKGAHLTNNSWGGGGYSQALYDAIGRARNANQLFLAAAGNDGRNTDSTVYYPSGYQQDNVIAVAATDSYDNLASFSNYGASTVDIGAPGVGIRSTTRSNSYASWNGTSMATPHVAGAAAMLLSRTGTAAAYTQIRSLLYDSADPVSSLAGKTSTGARLNVANAVASVGSATPPPPALKTVTVYPASTNVLESSTLRSGSAANLVSDNNLYYQVNSNSSGTRTSSWQASFPAVASDASALKVTYKGKNSRSCTQTVSIWNSSSGTWETLNSRSVSSTEVLLSNLAPAGPASDYVDPATGQVTVRVRCVRSSSTFYSSGDLLSLSYSTAA